MRRDLVIGAMAGDHEAFSELARLSVDRLHAVARLILHDPERAKDATQEALVAAWRDLPRFATPTSSNRGSVGSSCAPAIERHARSGIRRAIEVPYPETSTTACPTAAVLSRTATCSSEGSAASHPSSEP